MPTSSEAGEVVSDIYRYANEHIGLMPCVWAIPEDKWHRVQQEVYGDYPLSSPQAGRPNFILVGVPVVVKGPTDVI